MAAYTVVNLKEIEDQAPKFGLAPNLEARFPRDALETERLAMSYQRYAPGFRQPFGHQHKEQEEVYVVIGGSGRVKLGDEVVDLKQWDAVRVSSHTTRGFEAGSEGLELLVFGAPKTPLGDADITPGWWSE